MKLIEFSDAAFQGIIRPKIAQSINTTMVRLLVFTQCCSLESDVLLATVTSPKIDRSKPCAVSIWLIFAAVLASEQTACLPIDRPHGSKNLHNFAPIYTQPWSNGGKLQ